MDKRVYSFNEGNKNMRDILGGKGANIAEMTNLDLPVPIGFIVSTLACNEYYDNNEVLNESIKKEIILKLKELEVKTGKKLGDINNPLLLSVRSGARESMPGMLDTILNLGLNDEIVRNYPDKRFINDCYRRLISMYADVVKGYNKNLFEKIIINIKKEKKIKSDLELTTEDMQKIVYEYKKLYQKLSNDYFPQDTKIQLLEAIKAVFRSWNNERALVYRKLNNIPNYWGTAVNVQQMVYGNLNNSSATGVVFTRNPANGIDELFGEYLINAQGEDIVAGVRTPKSIINLKNEMPHIYNQLYNYVKKLENHYKDMQDIEFTVENNKLYILQTRNGKRTATAALKIALDLYNEKKLTLEETILKVDPKSLNQLLHPTLDELALKEAKVIAKGIAASPGGVSGKIYFSTNDILNHLDEETILVRKETSTEDIKGMSTSNGILTETGGMTSHAAVVARGLGKCCVSGCENLVIDEKNKAIIINDNLILKEGDYLSLNGNTGEVYEGRIPMVSFKSNKYLNQFMKLLDSKLFIDVRANADTKSDALQALEFNANGIGLVRTEHMFFNEDRILYVQAMILAENKEEREEALKKLQEMQTVDFEQIFKVMENKAVTIRYLDPPLHEFLPTTLEEIKVLSKQLNKKVSEIEEKVNSLKEFNPMMGHRGCRLLISYPEILMMQTRAIIDAVTNLDKLGIEISPEIMIPLVSDINEFKYVKKIIFNEIKQAKEKRHLEINFKIGAMIETPRACVIADEIAKEAEFLSFGTNDLTQMVYGFSRDDANKFLKDYLKKNVFLNNPFITIDKTGVGQLIIIAIKLARKINPNIKIGICGEHGGDAESVEFFSKIGLDYISCSPYRIPITKLAIVQSAIKKNKFNE